MNNPLENIEKLKKIASNKHELKIFDSMSNYCIKMDNKDRGYEPKCKVCNHEDKDKIEDLHECGYSNRDVMRKLGLEGDFSEQALGQHLNNHYPISRKYYGKIRLMEEKEIQKAIKTHPPLAKYLLDDDPEYSKIFLNKHGFCIFANDLCELIPKKTASDNHSVMEQLKKEFKGISDGYSFDKSDNIISVMVKLNKCYSCQLSTIQKKMTIKKKIIH